MPEPKKLRRRTARARRHASSGMGLIELMIAMTVLTVGMLGSMVMIITGMESNTRNKRDNSATILDQELLEILNQARPEGSEAYAIGVAEPISIMVNAFGTGTVSEEKMTQNPKLKPINPTG